MAQIPTFVVILVPGDRRAVEAVLEQCRSQNGGRLVGNPTVRDKHVDRVIEGETISAVIVEKEADPQGWWEEWDRVHGWKPEPPEESP